MPYASFFAPGSDTSFISTRSADFINIPKLPSLHDRSTVARRSSRSQRFGTDRFAPDHLCAAVLLVVPCPCCAPVCPPPLRSCDARLPLDGRRTEEQLRAACDTPDPAHRTHHTGSTTVQRRGSDAARANQTGRRQRERERSAPPEQITHARTLASCDHRSTAAESSLRLTELELAPLPLTASAPSPQVRAHRGWSVAAHSLASRHLTIPQSDRGILLTSLCFAPCAPLCLFWGAGRRFLEVR